MRRRGLELAVALSLLAATALSGAAGAQGRTRVRLAPGSGRPTTVFSISFLTPASTGTFGTIRRRDVLYAAGPASGTGCIRRVSITLAGMRAGRRERVRLRPRRLGGVWCVGRYRGQIIESQAIVCRRIFACPDLAIAPRTIARFSFRVRRGPAAPGSPGPSGGPPGPGPPASGPQFAGLQSAVTCVGLPPNILPRPRVFTLTWAPATDSATPSSAIVYDVYVSAAPSGEDFSTPAWTTPPGVGTFSVSVSRLGPVYFVVRARDSAGVEDQNTVERPGVNQCG